MEDGLCLKCGAVLIMPPNDFRMCSKCTLIIMKAKYAVGMKAQNKHKFKKTGVIIRKGQIARQTTSIGRPVD